MDVPLDQLFATGFLLALQQARPATSLRLGALAARVHSRLQQIRHSELSGPPDAKNVLHRVLRGPGAGASGLDGAQSLSRPHGHLVGRLHEQLRHPITGGASSGLLGSGLSGGACGPSLCGSMPASRLLARHMHSASGSGAGGAGARWLRRALGRPGPAPFSLLSAGSAAAAAAALANASQSASVAAHRTVAHLGRAWWRGGGSRLTMSSGSAASSVALAPGAAAASGAGHVYLSLPLGMREFLYRQHALLSPYYAPIITIPWSYLEALYRSSISWLPSLPGMNRAAGVE